MCTHGGCAVVHRFILLPKEPPGREPRGKQTDVWR